MNNAVVVEYPPMLSGPSLPWGSSRPPMTGGVEQNATLAFVGLLLLLLLVLVIRCFRVLLDPYSSMPASSWNDHKEALDRGQFDYMLV